MINFPAHKLADFLNDNTSIALVAPWWVYFWSKVKDPSELTLALRLISDEWNEFTKVARVEMTVLAPRTATPYDMITVFDTLNTLLLDKSDTDRIWFIENLRVKNVVEQSIFWPDYDLQDRLIMKKDYLFYYAP